MPDHTDWRQELRELIWAAQWGMIEPAQMDRLDALLQTGPEIRREYLQYAGLLTDLQYDVDSPLQADEASLPADPLPLPLLGNVPPSLLAFLGTRLGMAVLLTSIVTNVVAVILMIAYLAPRWNRADAPDEHLATHAAIHPRTFATLVAAQDAVWSRSEHRQRPGDSLTAGPRELISGTIDIRYANGTRLRLLAPCRYDLESLEEIRLDRGRLMAAVTRQAIGFTVVAPHARIVDLGTEFGVEVADSGETEVQVFVGRVELQPPTGTTSPMASVVIRGGQARRITRSGAGESVVETIPLSADTFGSRRIEAAELSSPARRWAEHRARLTRDPHAVAFYEFEPARGLSPTGANAADHEYLVPNRGGFDSFARIECAGQPPWTTGRWPGKSALALGERQTYLTVADAPPLRLTQAATLSAWLRLDAAPTAASLVAGKGVVPHRNYNLWVQPGAVKPFFQLNYFTADGDNRILDGRTPLELGRWYHVAGTISVERSILYVDGTEDASSGVGSAPMATSDSPFWIGRSPQDCPGQLAATIDELVVFDQALSASEIQTLYAEGKVSDR